LISENFIILEGMRREFNKGTQEVCKICGDKTTNFHSKCCNAHFEGAITPDGDFVIVCEKCGRFCAELRR